MSVQVPLETFLVLLFFAFAIPGVCLLFVGRGMYKGWCLKRQLRRASRSYYSSMGF